MQQGTWSQEEHDRFLAGVKIYPDGPWRLIARYVGTRSVRQVQTHAQKYHEKIARRMRGLRKERRNHVRMEHRIDGDIYNLPDEPAMSPVLLDQFRPYGHASPFASLLPPSFSFPTEQRAHGNAHMDKHLPTVQLPPLRLAMPPLAIGRDELPDEPSFDYFARAIPTEASSAVV